MTESLNATERRDSEFLIREMERHRAAPCQNCGGPLGHRQVLLSIGLGFKDAPRCAACLACGLGQAPEQLWQQFTQYLQVRVCYRAAWEWANRQEPEPDASSPTAASRFSARPLTSPSLAEEPAAKPAAPTGAGAEWDAGELGCGELVLELRLRLQALPPGERFRLLARDPGAPADLPAWCRMTGHRLLWAVHPEYWIQRKE